MAQIQQITASDQSDLERVRDSFAQITETIIAQAAQEVERLRAMNDREKMVKEQIKMNTVQTVRGVFNHCYLQITGRRAWDE